MNDEAPAPKWKMLPPNQRRVLGVLVEKAKTTPNGYPMTLNSLVTGCNQKSNRFPTMSLDADDVEDALESLRGAGAVAEVHGDGRTVKYRHYMKDWMAVDGTELAVMAELLLRGAQTIGELRGRAARMAKGQLSDMTTLRPILQALMQKKLVVPITAEGRGQIVTHGLYSDTELERVRRESGGGEVVATSSSSSAPPVASAAPAASSPVAPAQSSPVAPAQSSSSDNDLRREVASLREEVAKLRKEIEDIWSNIG